METLHGLEDDLLDGLPAERLQKIFDGIGGDCLFDIIKIFVPADHDQRHMRIMLCQVRKELHAVDARHLHIQDHKVGMQLGDQPNAGSAFFRFPDAGNLV